MSDRPPRLILLRHGRTAWNVANRAQGHTDIGLDETGRAQAAAVAPLIAAEEPVWVCSSDLARARETARAVADACGLDVRTDPRLREYAVGTNRAGLTLDEYAERFPDEHADLLANRIDRIPGRETDEQLLARMLPALEECAGSLETGQTGVVVSHGAALKVALAGFLGWPETVSRSLIALGNCHWVMLEYSSSGWFAGEPTWRVGAYNRGVPTPDFVSGSGIG